MDKEKSSIQKHESPVRKMISESKNTPFYPLKSLTEAKSYSDGVVIFEGDYGGQIYLTCPTNKIKCTETVLQRLIIDIDSWCFRYPDSTKIYYERVQENTGIWGGTGGGIVKSDAWIHPELHELGIAEEVIQVLMGQKKRIKYK